MRPLLLLLCLLAAGCGGADDEAAAPPEGWTTFRDAEQGITVRFPSAWHRATRSLTPALTDPRERLSIGTYPLRAAGRSRCAQFPLGALRAAGPRDVFFTLQERAGRPTLEFAPRERPFALGAADSSESTACIDGPAPWRSHWVSFGEAGRPFYVLAVIGRDAPPERVAQLREVLDSLVFDRRAAEE